MLRYVLALLLALFTFAANAQVTNSLVTTSGSLTLSYPGVRNSIKAIRIAWTSNADGEVLVSGIAIDGTIKRVVFANGSATPTANYDVTLGDRDSYDVLATLGGNIPVNATPGKCITPLIGNGTTTAEPISTQGHHTLTITNAGDSKTGYITIYLEQ